MSRYRNTAPNTYASDDGQLTFGRTGILVCWRGTEYRVNSEMLVDEAIAVWFADSPAARSRDADEIKDFISGVFASIDYEIDWVAGAPEAVDPAVCRTAPATEEVESPNSDRDPSLGQTADSVNEPVSPTAVTRHLSAQTSRLIEAAETGGVTTEILREIDDQSGWGRWIRLGEFVVSFSYHRNQVECWLYPAHLVGPSELAGGKHVPGMSFEWFARRFLDEQIPGLGASDIDWYVATILRHLQVIDAHFAPAAWETTRQAR